MRRPLLLLQLLENSPFFVFLFFTSFHRFLPYIPYIYICRKAMKQVYLSNRKLKELLGERRASRKSGQGPLRFQGARGLVCNPYQFPPNADTVAIIQPCIRSYPSSSYPFPFTLPVIHETVTTSFQPPRPLWPLINAAERRDQVIRVLSRYITKREQQIVCRHIAAAAILDFWCIFQVCIIHKYIYMCVYVCTYTVLTMLNR